ncbi:MAG TPA: hypothetical protein VK327_18245 [Candidatus Paceibacterota bacterium]|nr:hypothetical protein [Candidatus Paceibacterota bacterium]
MSSRLFETFCELLETLPVKAVIRAADAERRMVQNDLDFKRLPPDQDSLSVLGFCNFLVNTAQGIQLSLPIWPTEHCEFYRRIVRKLVDAGELPPAVENRFDRTSACGSSGFYPH